MSKAKRRRGNSAASIPKLDNLQPSPHTDLPKRGFIFCKLCIVYIVFILICTAVIYSIGLMILSNYLQEADGSHQPWWQRKVIYQIYPRSFHDSDGDGVGDINGITNRLDYFVNLGVGAIWLSPVFTSPMVDFGYDISNFTEIDPIFGTMEDFGNMVAAAHERGLHVILDVVPNHSSDLHPWFVESMKPEKNGYSDYYIWKNGKRLENGTIVPPNNWISVFGGPMWTWNPNRKQYYFHQFTKEQPDLNYDSFAVREEMLKVFEFWMFKGVDGFRMDAVRHLYEDSNLQDEQPSKKDNTMPNEYDFNEHLYTIDQPKTHELIQSWRLFLDGYEQRFQKHIFVMAEVFELCGSEPVMPYYHSGADFPFNFNLQAVNKSCDGQCMYGLVDDWMGQMPRNKWPNWVIGSHDTKRISHKVGLDLVNAMNILLLTLPGTAITYYGEELGMEEVPITYAQTVDPAGKNAGPERYELFSRDPCRSPMQWTDGVNGGFSTSNTTWLPMHSNYETVNTKTQWNDPSGTSTIQLYSILVRLRSEHSFQNGDFDYNVVNQDIFSYIRYASGHPAYLIAINFGATASTADYRNYYDGKFITDDRYFLPEVGEIVLTSSNVDKSVLRGTKSASLQQLTLQSHEAVVIRFWPE